MSGRTVISEEVCERLRDAHAEGRSVGEIAAEFDYTSSAVRRHVHDYCSHATPNGRWGSSADTECPFCGESVRHLPGHLPNCAEANPSREEPQPRPTGDWEW